MYVSRNWNAMQKLNDNAKKNIRELHLRREEKKRND